MPLPLILGVGAAFAGLLGVGAGLDGAEKMKDANNTIKAAQNRHQRNIDRFDENSEFTNKQMDLLGTLELSILNDFEEFSNTIEKIQNRPEFQKYQKDGVTLPKYNKAELKDVSVGAGVLLGGLGGAAIGSAGGFAAAGATTSAIMALGTASTGTAIASLSGAAATNATLAALGGGALAAGGGGIALGTTILGATTLGVGILVGGIIFSATGEKISSQADEAYDQMLTAERTIDKACDYLIDLRETAEKYHATLDTVNKKYKEVFSTVKRTVDENHKTNWQDFTKDERSATKNSVLLVGLLYNMCKVSLVKKSENQNDINSINSNAVEESILKSKKVLQDIG